MKKLIAFFLCASLLLALFSGCTVTEPTAVSSTEAIAIVTTDAREQAAPTQAPVVLNWDQGVQFTGMTDASLPRYLEDTVYTSLVTGLDSDKYFVESVQAVYVSQEYLAEVAYLTLNQVAQIQQESGYPLDVIKQFHRMDEYKVFRDIGLQAQQINGNLALVRTDIDPFLLDENGLSNLERMMQGMPPKDITGESFQLHHIGQQNNGTLAILTKAEHQQNYSVLHKFILNESLIDRDTFNKITKPDFWTNFAKCYVVGG